MNEVLCLFLLTVNSLSACSSSTSSGPTVLQYEPSVVCLTGEVSVEQRFGPPNYGETPDIDERVDVPILHTVQPFAVRGDPSSETNTESFSGLDSVQLVFLHDLDKARSFDGRKVTVHGSLSTAESGHHFTNVILIVTRVDELPVSP